MSEFTILVPVGYLPKGEGVPPICRSRLPACAAQILGSAATTVREFAYLSRPKKKAPAGAGWGFCVDHFDEVH